MAARKTTAKRGGRKATVKTKEYAQLTVSAVKIPKGGVVERHVHHRDYVVIPHTAGKVKFIVRQGEKIVKQGTKNLTVGKPIHFSAGPKGRDVELRNLGEAIHFAKVLASKGKAGK